MEAGEVFLGWNIETEKKIIYILDWKKFINAKYNGTSKVFSPFIKFLKLKLHYANNFFISVQL